MIAQSAAAGGDGASGASLLIPTVLVFIVMYFLILRPQSQQQDKQKQFLAQLKKGDEVVLQNGFFARVYEVRDADVTVELLPSLTKVRTLKSGITGASAAPTGKAAELKSEAEKKA
jgi:preprotein translocase subunit YajC